MKYYARTVLVRKPVNKFGRLGYVETEEYVKTNDIAKFNKGKRIPFYESESARQALRSKDKQADKVYQEEKTIVSRHASKGGRFR